MAAQSLPSVSLHGRHTDIIAKLEAATGPDRKLDAEIMVAIGGARRVDDSTFYGPNEKVWSFGEHEDDHGAWNGPLPYVTASIDRSLALAEEQFPGVWHHIAKGRLRGAEPLYGAVLLFGPDEALGAGEHEHGEALALLLALFRSLQSQGVK